MAQIGIRILAALGLTAAVFWSTIAAAAPDDYWQPYRNQDYAVFFYYPKAWTACTPQDPGRFQVVFSRLDTKNKTLLICHDPQDLNLKVMFSVIKEAPPTPFGPAIKPKLEKAFETKIEAFQSFKLKGNEALRCDVTVDEDPAVPALKQRIVAVRRPAETLVWAFTAPQAEFDNQDAAHFKPILDTVEFLRPRIESPKAVSGTPRFPVSSFRDAGQLGVPKRAKSGWSFLFNVLLCLIFVGCVAFLYTEGMWGNAVRLINVVTAALLAVNFFEPVANMLDGWFPTFTVFWDFLALWAMFGIFLVVFRLLTDRLSKVKVRFLKIVDRIGSVFFAGWVGWVLMCFMIMTLHTAPLGRNFMFDGFQPEKRMLLGLAPDRQWLHFVRRVSRGQFCRSAPAGQPDRYVFDPHEDFRDKYARRRLMLEKHVLMTGKYRVLLPPSFR